MKSLITGGAGFIGRHLVDHLLKTHPSESIFTIDPHESPSPDVKHFINTLDREEKALQIVKEVEPDSVYHLAGISRVTDKIDFLHYFSTNFLTTMSLIRAIEKLDKPITFFFASSVHVYGNPEQTVTESSTARPLSPYGYSKYLAEEALKDAVQKTKNLKVIVGRLYNCIGPGQAEGFVASDLCNKIVQLKKTGEKTLKTGPLSSYRRFLDVRDLVELLPKLVAASNTNRFEIYNIAAPNELSIKDMLDTLLKNAGLSPEIESEKDTTSNQFRGLHLSTEKLLNAIPDASFRPLEETLKDMFAWTTRHHS